MSPAQRETPNSLFYMPLKGRVAGPVGVGSSRWPMKDICDTVFLLGSGVLFILLRLLLLLPRELMQKQTKEIRIYSPLEGPSRY